MCSVLQPTVLLQSYWFFFHFASYSAETVDALYSLLCTIMLAWNLGGRVRDGFSPVRILLDSVFGMLGDWRASLMPDGLGSSANISVHWAAFCFFCRIPVLAAFLLRTHSTAGAVFCCLAVRPSSAHAVWGQIVWPRLSSAYWTWGRSPTGSVCSAWVQLPTLWLTLVFWCRFLLPQVFLTSRFDSS